MALKQCDKCSEMVDVAKAFCPGCGHAFVDEETRKEASSFDTMDSTVQLGQTMYNQMLSDMGLNASQTGKSPEKRVEVIAPLTPATKPAAAAPDKPKLASYKKWFILAGIVIVLFSLILLVLVAAVVYYSGIIN